MPRVMITGSSGLIGSESAEHYSRLGWDVDGIDNNLRGQLFGPGGDTTWNRRRLQKVAPSMVHHELDIRDRDAVFELVEARRPDVVIHAAAQPSHDHAAAIPLVDFDVNAIGTVNMLEAARRFAPEGVFLHMSTNKVYGDAPNELPLVEHETRWDYARPEDATGISESCRVDQSLHSLYGASKLAADVMAQEYARYYGLKVAVFRGGCITGPNHAGVEAHGFLSWLVKQAVRDEEYVIFGYGGKQVRDQVHSADVIAVFDAFLAAPRPGEVYNLGGGRGNSASVLECISLIEGKLGRPVRRRYDPRHRRGDHICYISDLRKLQDHFPSWGITRSLDRIVDELVEAHKASS